MNRKINRLMSIILLGLLIITGSRIRVYAQDASVSYQTFYDDLSPYGQWISDPQYGNVWLPNEGGDFRPYGTDGYWVMTDYGNTWVSTEPWGWAAYHYGRWTYDPYYGWMWIPGYEWAPAWVSWRFGGGYCGWAPLGPGGGLDYACPNSWWVFIGPQYLYDHNFYHHWSGPHNNGNYLAHTTPMRYDYVNSKTNVRYNFGPRADAITAVTHQPVKVYHVAQDAKPGKAAVNGNIVSMYHPAINKATAGTAHPANAIPAPRAISTPHENNTLNAAKQPAFKTQGQNAPHGNNGATVGGNRVANTNPEQQHNNNSRPAPQQRQQPQTQPRQQPQQRPQPAPQPRQQPQQRPQPMPQSRPQPAPQQHQEAPRGGGERR